MKYLSLLIALFLFSNSLFAENAKPTTKVVITKHGGQQVELNPGDNYIGYDQVYSRSSETPTGNKVTTLDCNNPGYARCRIISGIICTYEDLHDYADNEISNGNLIGSYINNIYENGIFYYRNVIWQSTGSYDTTEIIITLQEADL